MYSTRSQQKIVFTISTLRQKVLILFVGRKNINLLKQSHRRMRFFPIPSHKGSKLMISRFFILFIDQWDTNWLLHLIDLKTFYSLSLSIFGNSCDLNWDCFSSPMLLSEKSPPSVRCHAEIPTQDLVPRAGRRLKIGLSHTPFSLIFNWLTLHNIPLCQRCAFHLIDIL